MKLYYKSIRLYLGFLSVSRVINLYNNLPDKYKGILRVPWGIHELVKSESGITISSKGYQQF